METRQKTYKSARWVSLGVAALLAGSLSACLSLLPEASSRLIGIVAVVSFANTFLILHILLVFILLREMNQLEAALEKIRKKDYSFVYKMPRSLFHLLNPIRHKMLRHAQAQALEIEQLRQLSQFRREFLADVSHELKTPLFAAQGFIDTVLEEAGKWRAPHISFLKKASSNLERVNHMLNDVITTARMESGAIQMKFEPVDLYAVADCACADLVSLCKKKEISLNLQPRGTIPMMVRADKQYIGQVLSNLIKNAIQYNYKGGEVSISFAVRPTEVEVLVADTGRGIPQKDLHRIFERFYRVDKSRSQKGGGAGIGLALVKHILEAHNSRPQVVTKKKSGSTFSFALKKAFTDSQLMTA